MCNLASSNKKSSSDISRYSTFITPLGLGTKKRKTIEKPPGWEALVIERNHYWPGADPTF
jgi:hypothetical protein